MIPNLIGWTWWLKWCETRIITEEGIFADQSVPDDYGGPQLTVKVIQQVIMCTASCHFLTLTFGDTTGVKDKNREEGLGIFLDAWPAAEIAEAFITGPGPSADIVNWVGEENQFLPEDFRTTLNAAYIAAKANIEQ